MSKELNCRNCCIGDFKYELCDCDGRFCKEFKKIGTAEDFEKDVLEHVSQKTEVVRCRDCKYGEERIGDYRCGMLDEDWDIRFSPMHFCSYGRRREDGEA